MRQILLVQVRDPKDIMIGHEVECIRNRFGRRPYTLHVRNAVEEQGHPNWLEGMDGFLIGGSGDFSVHHPKSQRWVPALRTILDRALEDAIPSFGICFGHQLLGRHLGSEVRRKRRHRNGHGDSEHHGGRPGFRPFYRIAISSARTLWTF